MNLESPTPPQPEVASAYEYSFATMKTKFLELLVVVLLVIALHVPVWIISGAAQTNIASIWAAQIFSFFYGILIGIPLEFGVAYIFLKAVRGEPFEIKDVFEPFNNFVNVIAAGILMGAIIGIGFLFLIIPGIIFACKLAFVPYLVMDKKMDPVEAVKTSWNMTTGHAVTIFLMGLLAIPVAILGFILLFVGIIPASMWIEGAFASIYFAVDSRLESTGT
jgi:uncharacterized membrane protein